MGHGGDGIVGVDYTIFYEIGEAMMIDFVFGGIAFIGVILAVGKYAYTSKQIENCAEKEPTHSCLCTQCANFKPKEKEIL